MLKANEKNNTTNTDTCSLNTKAENVAAAANSAVGSTSSSPQSTTSALPEYAGLDIPTFCTETILMNFSTDRDTVQFQRDFLIMFNKGMLKLALATQEIIKGATPSRIAAFQYLAAQVNRSADQKSQDENAKIHAAMVAVLERLIKEENYRPSDYNASLQNLKSWAKKALEAPKDMPKAFQNVDFSLVNVALMEGIASLAEKDEYRAKRNKKG